MNIKRYYLIFTFVTVSIIGLLYGVFPHWFGSTFLNIEELHLDLVHVFRAVMCLYLALGLFWLYGTFNKKYSNAAILTTSFLRLVSSLEELSATWLTASHQQF